MNLLEAERGVHGKRAKELRTARKKFASMRWKREPVDAEHQA